MQSDTKKWQKKMFKMEKRNENRRKERKNTGKEVRKQN